MDDNNVSQCQSRAPNFPWNFELVTILVSILMEYQKKNGSKQAYNWKEITATFISKTGKSGVNEFCRNKFETMKKEYKAWKSLRNSETGLGWDEKTRMITASNEWWNRKIKEDVNCKKYKNKGMEAEYEELLTSLFDGNVATGRLATSAGMVREAIPDPISLADDAELGLGEDDGEGGDFFRNFVGTVNEGGGSSYSGVQANDDEPVQFTEPTPTPAAATGNKEKGPMKRKRRQSVGSSKLEAFLERSHENSDKLLAVLQEEVNSKARDRERVTQRGLEVVKRLVQNDMVESGSPLWCYIVGRTKIASDMNILLNLDSDEERVRWLTWEYERSLM